MPRNNSNVNYYFADHLGTNLASTNSSGSVCYDADFYPFGGERILTDTCDSAYKFTGKERDSESSLDDFGARYYSSSLGRFMSVDPIAVHPQKMMDPQQFNMYTYVRNNPLKLTDPTGEIINLANLTDEERKKLIEELTTDTGLSLAYNSKTGDLDVVSDPSKANAGSATFRKDLVDAVNSKDTFNVVDDPNAPVGSYDSKTKTASIDFAFFSKKNDAFTLGLTFYHEVIGHGLHGYGDPEKKSRDDAQATLDLFRRHSAFQLERKVAEELGIPVRMDYLAHQGQNGKWYIRVAEPLSEMSKRPLYQRFWRPEWDVEIPTNKIP